MQYISGVIPAMRAIPQPVIAAINGPAYGGGLCLSLGADIRVASETASFCFAGVHHGLTGAEMGISYLLPRAIGSSNASEILLTGRRYDAAAALRMGLVSEVHPSDALLQAAVDMAKAGEEQFYGFELAKQLLESDGSRKLTAHGTLYKALGRMENAGLLESVWEDPDLAAAIQPALEGLVR